MSEIDAQLFQSFNDAMPLAACFVDLHGKVIYWNAAAESITGYRRHEVLGRTYRTDLLIQLSADHATAAPACPVRDALRDGASLAASLFLRHKDGYRLPVRVYAFALRNAMNEMQGAGEIFEPLQPHASELHKHSHLDHDFEMATGLPALEESREQLKALSAAVPAAGTVLMLIEMSQQREILQHGGAAMLHQAIRVLARTVAGLLPEGHYVGCWTDWRLLAIVNECSPDELAELKARLSAVGSSCAVKWWGDRVPIGVRAAACLVDPSQAPEKQIQTLESDLRKTADGEE
jgi:PAS domain S-box-containing protein